MNANKPILCLDFDGVISSYASGWQGAAYIPDPPVPGAIAWLEKARHHFQIVIYSSRSREPGAIEAMQDWLSHHGAQSDLMTAITFAREKPAAFLTIDDRAIQFNGDWNSLDPVLLLEFKPWNKRARQTSPSAEEVTDAEHPRSNSPQPEP